MLFDMNRTDQRNLYQHFLDRIRIDLGHKHARFHLRVLDDIFPRKHAVPFDINVAEVTQVHRVETLHVETVRPEGDPGGNQKDTQDPATTLKPAQAFLRTILDFHGTGTLALFLVVAYTASKECGFRTQIHSSKIF